MSKLFRGEENTLRNLGQILLLVILLPSPAFAQSCADQRPNWTPGTDVSALSEAVALFSSPVSLILLLATALCFRSRHQWGSVVVVVLWTTLVSLIVFADAGGRAAGIAEGCIGSPGLYVVAVAALCVGLIFYTAPKPRKDVL
ncbi:MAG: hypothetical protein AAGF36_01480 [Pseudomonadota bacterium]